MKATRNISGILILLLCIAGIYQYQQGSSSHEKPEEDGSKWMKGQVLHENHPAVLPAKDPRIDDVSGVHHPDPLIIQAFVEESGNSPEAISWAFLLTHDRIYIEKLKNHSDSEFALQMLALYDVGAESRLYWAEQLNEKDQANGLGKLLMAKALLEANRPDAAIDAFSEALESERLSSPVKVLQQPLVGLLKKVSPSKTTAFAIHDVASVQSTLASRLFPWSFGGLFEGKTQKEADAVALQIVKLTDKLSSSGSFDLINIEGFSESRSVIEGIRIRLMMGFERTYGEGSSKSFGSLDLQGYATQSMAEGRRRQDEIKKLTPEQLDARVRAAIRNLKKEAHAE